MTLRASAKQNIWATQLTAASVRSTPANNIAVAAGATLNFGQLKVDGMIANNDGAAAATTGTSNGILRLDAFMSRVAVHYWF